MIMIITPGSHVSNVQELGSETPYEPLETPFPSQVWERTRGEALV